MANSTRILFIALLLVLGGCSQSGRGAESPSPDGNTYLIVEEPEGGGGSGCVILVDGAVWRHRSGVQGEIAPGEHVIKCTTPIRFSIRQGTVFSFNNWTP